ncbi:hypothetical protein LJR225_002880 [Phenylobacterium sp. LjRoot225]
MSGRNDYRRRVALLYGRSRSLGLDVSIRAVRHPRRLAHCLLGSSETFPRRVRFTQR